MSRSLAETLLAASADEIADALAVPDFDSDPGDEELKPLSNNDHPTAPATGTDTRTAPPPTLQPTPVHLIAKGAVSRDNKSPSVPGTVPALRTEGGTPEPVILARAAREGSGCFEDGHEGREQPHVSPCRSPSRSPHLDGHPASPLEHDRVRNEVANLRLFLEQSKRKEDLLEDELLTAQTLALRYKRQAEESLEASRLAESPTLKVKHLAASEAYEARYAEVQASHSTLLEPHDIVSHKGNVSLQSTLETTVQLERSHPTRPNEPTDLRSVSTKLLSHRAPPHHSSAIIQPSSNAVYPAEALNTVTLRTCSETLVKLPREAGWQSRRQSLVASPDAYNEIAEQQQTEPGDRQPSVVLNADSPATTKLATEGVALNSISASFEQHPRPPTPQHQNLPLPLRPTADLVVETFTFEQPHDTTPPSEHLLNLSDHYETHVRLTQSRRNSIASANQKPPQAPRTPQHSAAQTPTGLVAGTMSFQQQEDHHHQQQSIAVPVPNLSVPNLSGNYEHVKLPLSRRHSSASVGSTPADTVHQPPDAMTPQEDAHHLHDDTHLHVTHATSVGQPLELRSTVEPHVVPCLGNPQSLFLAAESTKYAIGSHVASLESATTSFHQAPDQQVTRTTAVTSPSSEGHVSIKHPAETSEPGPNGQSIVLRSSFESYGQLDHMSQIPSAVLSHVLMDSISHTATSHTEPPSRRRTSLGASDGDTRHTAQGAQSVQTPQPELSRRSSLVASAAGLSQAGKPAEAMELQQKSHPASARSPYAEPAPLPHGAAALSPPLPPSGASQGQTPAGAGRPSLVPYHYSYQVHGDTPQPTHPPAHSGQTWAPPSPGQPFHTFPSSVHSTPYMMPATAAPPPSASRPVSPPSHHNPSPSVLQDALPFTSAQSFAPSDANSPLGQSQSCANSTPQEAVSSSSHGEVIPVPTQRNPSMTPRQPSEASYAYTPDEVSLLNDPQPAAAANVLRNRSFAADSRAARSPSLLSSQPDAGSLSRGNSWSSQKGYGRVYPAMSEMSCPQTPQEYAFAPAAVGTPGSTGLPPHRGVGSRSNSFVHRARSSSQLSNEWWEPGEHAPNAHPRIAAQEADEDARVAVARQLSLQEAQTGFNATMPVGRNGLASLAVSEASQQSNDLHPPAETDHAQAIDLGSLYHNPSFSTRKPDEPRPTHTPVPPARSAASSETHESRPAISTPKYEPASSIVLMPKADQVADPAQAGFETPVFASTPPVAEGSQPTLAAARADPHPPPPGTVVLIESSQSFRQLLPGGGSPQEAAEAGEAAEAQRRGRDPADDEGKVLSAASSPASVPDTVRRLSVSARRLSPPRSPLGPGSADQWKARALAAEAEVVVLRTGPANPARHAALARERDLWKTDAMAAKDALTQQREVGGRPAKGGKAAGKKAQDASRTKSERAPAKQAGLGYGTPHPSFQHGGKPQPPVFLTPTSPDNAGSPPLGFKPALADRVFDTTAYRGISPVATPSTHPHPSFLRTIDDIERDSSASDSGAKPRPTRTQRKPAHHRSTSLPSKPRPSPQTRGSGAREDAETPRKPWSISGMGTSPYRKPPVPMPSPSRGANPPKAVKPDAGDEPRETPSTGQPSPPKVTGAKPFVSVPFVPEQPWVPPPCKSTSASPPRERSGSAPPEACSPPEKRDWRQPSSPQSVEAIPGGTYGYTAVPKGGGAPAAGLRGRSTSPQNRPVFAAPGRQPDRAAGNRTDPPALRPSRSRSKGREGGDHGASPPRGLGGGGLQGVLEKALSGSEAAGGGNFFGARLHAEQSPGCVPPGGRVPSGRSILRTPGRHHVGGSPPARGHSEPQSMSARDSLSHLSGEEAGGYVSPQPALHSLDTMQPELRRYSAYSATPRGEPRSHPYMSTPPSAPPARSSTEPFTLVQRVSMPRTDPLHWSQQIYNPEFSLPGDRSPSGGSQQQGTGVQTTFHFIPSLASGAAPPWGVWGQKEVVVVDRAAASFGPADYPRLSLLNQPRTSPMRPYRASSMSVGDVSSAGPPLLSA